MELDQGSVARRHPALLKVQNRALIQPCPGRELLQGEPEPPPDASQGAGEGLVASVRIVAEDRDYRRRLPT